MSRFVRLDAAESAFFRRELEFIKAKTYDIKYPNLMSRMFVPVSNEVPSGAAEVTYQQFDRVGRAQIIKPGATDLPRVDVFGTEFSRPVRWGGVSYGYNLIEIRQAMMAGRPLDSKKAAAARRAQEELIDEVAAIGAPDWGITTGFINNATLVAAVEAATGAWDAPATTADEIIGDVQVLFSAIVNATEGMERPNTLLIPDSQYAALATRPRSTTSDTTILNFLLQSIPGLTAIEPWWRLKLAGAGGASDRAIMYNRSPDYLEQDIPNEFEQLPVFQRGTNFEIETLVATAGTAWYYPLSARYMDGV
jgi:hypothetical protein